MKLYSYLNSAKTIGSIFLLFCLASCEKQEETNWTYQLSKLKHSHLALETELLERAKAAYVTFDTEIKTLNYIPSSAVFMASQKNWIITYNKFLLISPFRYNTQSMDIGLKQNHDLFDLSPLDIAYLDYTAQSPSAGIINNATLYPTISSLNIKSWNLVEGNKISCGFHALEFLLWGEDLSLTQPGQRTNSDYFDIPENTRRRSFFFNVSNVLKTTIAGLGYSDSYKNSLLKMTNKEFSFFLTETLSQFILTDFIQNTLEKPLLSQNPSDEISDFSDNSMENIRTKFLALSYVLDGTEIFADDSKELYFMGEFIKEVNPDGMAKITASLETIEANLKAITVNFEVAISTEPYKSKLQSTITELTSINSVIGETFQVIK